MSAVVVRTDGKSRKDIIKSSPIVFILVNELERKRERDYQSLSYTTPPYSLDYPHVTESLLFLK